MSTPSGPAADPTLDPALQSWVESANDPASDFPIQNLPLCGFVAERDGHAHAHLGVAIGDQVVDVSMLAEAGAIADDDEEVLDALSDPFWYGVLGVPGMAGRVRPVLQRFLRADTAAGQRARRVRSKALRPISETRFLEPVHVFNYTDFYASVHHATTVGSMFRPENPLLPNYKHIPIGYHGRASSLVVSGTPVRRPWGQQAPPDNEPEAGPSFAPCRMLDYELEVGAVIGVGNRMGEPIAVGEAHRHLLGLCLVNDWSARDIQKWEYQPLGPFLAKNFATTISPFIVTLEALAPFRCPAPARPKGDPCPLAYLVDEGDQAAGGFDITLEVLIRTEKMAAQGLDALRLSRGSFRHMYWTVAQLLTHHASGGCNLQPGDLLASGTVSGPEPESRGCLLELTWQGHGPDGKPRPRKPIDLPTGETRTFLADGDEVIMRGHCVRDGFRRIGFGECRGKVEPART
ncbi:MAG: fumarylacetoacetase [Phycisphaerae bacterium]|nr:fumarylacetoacetase [Phycisphaerae bacterium]